jgi:hypothetical protein
MGESGHRENQGADYQENQNIRESYGQRPLWSDPPSPGLLT